MHGEIRRLKGNLRYRILNINEDYYLIDTGASPWKAISPFLFLLFSNPGYKIDKETALQLLTNEKVQTRKFAQYSLIPGGIAITFSGFLTSITDRMHISSTIPINIIITIISSVLILLTFGFILKKLKQNVENTIDYNELPKQEIKIYMPKISHITKISFFSLFFITVSVCALIIFIQNNYLFALLIGLVMLLLFLFLGGLGLDHGKYKIKFK
ncbi:DUF443 family protein [Terribacillus aidingensis]|uniref:DUF443 family protein n=1 Tax=Terribacillus aidingensis TaxID=586416 RepID=UPI00344D4B11